MPRLDGYETTREIRRREQKRRDLGEEFPRVTIIALTAHSLTGEAEKCLAAGMNEFMAKPMKISELSTICRFLDGSVSNPESPASLNMPIDGTSIQDFDEEIIQLYFSETARRITEIEDALNREDKQEITRLAHAVRGNALAIKDIGSAGTDFSAADIKYNTLGVGYVYYMNPNLKWVLYYAMVKNEKTQLSGFTSDISDNVFTSRLQFRF